MVLLHCLTLQCYNALKKHLWIQVWKAINIIHLVEVTNIEAEKEKKKNLNFHCNARLQCRLTEVSQNTGLCPSTCPVCYLPGLFRDLDALCEYPWSWHMEQCSAAGPSPAARVRCRDWCLFHVPFLQHFPVLSESVQTSWPDFWCPSGDFTGSGTPGADPALPRRKLLAARCSEESDSRENKALKQSISLWKARWPCISSFGSHSSSRFAVSLLSIQSVSNFICAHFTQSLLISLKGDCLIFPFACFHF